MANNTCNFVLKFDGPALTESRMDVAQLAPALLALSDSLSALNTLVNKNDAKVTLQVRAMNRGCFIVDFLLNQDILSQVGALLTGAGLAGYCNAYTLLRSLVDLWLLKKWLGGRAPDKTEISSDHSTVIYYQDNRQFETNYYTYLGFTTPSVNDSCAKVAEPLHEEGIESFSISNDDIAQTFDKGDLPALSATSGDRVLTSDTTTRAVMIETAAFKDKNAKWRVRLGERESVFVTISDADFLERIDSGEERFGKGDVLLVQLEAVQTVAAGKLNMAYSIKKVLEHKTSAEQLALF